jgi:peptidoglycan hydrolase-like protein with peptidoglycan-binding domain
MERKPSNSLRNIATQSNLRSDRFYNWTDCTVLPAGNDFIPTITMFSAGALRLNPQRIYKLESIILSARHVIAGNMGQIVEALSLTFSTSQRVNQSGVIQDNNLLFSTSTNDTEVVNDAILIHGDKSIIQYEPKNFYFSSQVQITVDAKLRAAHGGVGLFQTYIMLDYKEFGT